MHTIEVLFKILAFGVGIFNAYSYTQIVKMSLVAKTSRIIRNF